jgi:hypothetical protein
MKALSIIGIVLCPILFIFNLLAIDELRCYGGGYDCYSYVSSDAKSMVILLALVASIFLLAISIVGLVTANRYNRLKKG